MRPPPEAPVGRLANIRLGRPAEVDTRLRLPLPAPIAELPAGVVRGSTIAHHGSMTLVLGIVAACAGPHGGRGDLLGAGPGRAHRVVPRRRRPRRAHELAAVAAGDRHMSGWPSRDYSPIRIPRPPIAARVIQYGCGRSGCAGRWPPAVAAQRRPAAEQGMRRVDHQAGARQRRRPPALDQLRGRGSPLDPLDHRAGPGATRSPPSQAARPRGGAGDLHAAAPNRLRAKDDEDPARGPGGVFR